MNKSWKLLLLIFFLILTNLILIVIDFPDNNIHIIACDVGQGDALLITHKKTQILIDGGPDRMVIDCLSEYMPFWDRNIELIVLTHPETDHFMGLIEVFKRYNVNIFLANSLENSSKGYQVLKKLVGGTNTRVVHPRQGTMMGNSMMQLDILHPSEEYISTNASLNKDKNTEGLLDKHITKDTPNNFSIVITLASGKFRALLTGDVEPGAIKKLIDNGLIEDVDYIKVPHHGSKNGLTKELLNAAKPEVAIISVGENPWGHPNEEIIKMLDNEKVRVFRTDIDGNIEIITDGERYWKRK